MDIQLPEFSTSQWDFLALLEAIGEPVSIDILCTLVPLTPGELLDLIRLTKSSGWLENNDDNTFVLGESGPTSLITELKKINTATRIKTVHNKIHDLGLHKSLNAKIHSRLLGRSGQEYDAAVMEYDFAMKAVERGNLKLAMEHLERALTSLNKGLGDRNYDMLFISASLAISNIRSRLKTGMSKIPDQLHQAMLAADRQGDRRAHTLVSLHFGRHFTMIDKLDESLSLLASGLEEVKALGDEDILENTAEFVGLYYFIQGLYKDAADNFETALHTEITSNTILKNEGLPLLLAYSLYSTGRYARAIGVLDSHWRRAVIDSQEINATTYRTSLGLILLLMGYKKQAVSHLEEALKEAKNQNNFWSLYEAEGSLAYYHFIEGRMDKAYATAASCWAESAQTDPFVRRPIWGHVFEMFYAFHKHGYPPVPGYNFEKEMEKTLNGVNIHLRGVALRIQAKQMEADDGDSNEVLALLTRSEADLVRSGDPIHLARTKLDLARASSKEKNHEQASQKALEAWELLSGYSNESFPEDLKSLVNATASSGVAGKNEDILTRFMDMLSEFYPCTDMTNFFYRVVAATCHFFGTERSGLFLFEEDRPQLQAGYNLTVTDLETREFRIALNQIKKAREQKKPIIVHPNQSLRKTAGVPVRTILCLPFVRKRDNLPGVLYHECTYEKSSIEFIEPVILKRIGDYLSTSIDRFEDYFNMLNSNARTRHEDSLPVDTPESWELKAQSPIMLDLLSRARQVADSEASVLILGETGVGKDLLARQIHAMSSRRHEPFIEIDLTSLPETLVESELFGHEKGAFTGADRQKKGRMELAHGGTLFIDEVGDIPKPVQIKILRALQEKTFVRVGGTRKLTSDFRLIAATNRDLEKAVEEGNFREDLYYRLNVVPLTVPPLKDRGNDIMLLAQHFLDHYAGKYKRNNNAFSPEDKAKLCEYHWPGNVRELKNIIERAVILSHEENPELILPVGGKPTQTDHFSDEPTLEELQRRYINYILDLTGGKVSGPDGASAILGINRTTLYSRMKKLGIA